MAPFGSFGVQFTVISESCRGYTSDSVQKNGSNRIISLILERKVIEKEAINILDSRGLCILS